METAAPADGETVEVVDGVHLAQLAAGERMSVQSFHVEPGASVPEHSHHHEQAGYVTSGALTFLVDGDEFVLSTGESYVVPGGQAHAAENRREEPVHGIDIFSPPRTNPDWME